MPRDAWCSRKERTSQVVKSFPVADEISFLPCTTLAMPLLQQSRPKVLVPETLSADGLALLCSDLDVDERKGLSAEELLEIIPNYEALVVRSETKVTADVLHAARRLKVVARAGVGVDNVGQLSSKA